MIGKFVTVFGLVPIYGNDVCVRRHGFDRRLHRLCGARKRTERKMYNLLIQVLIRFN